MTDPGEGPGGPGSPLFLDQTDARRVEKKVSKTAPPIPYHRVWVTAPLIWRPGPATDQYHPLVEMVLRVLVQCVNN